MRSRRLARLAIACSLLAIAGGSGALGWRQLRAGSALESAALTPALPRADLRAPRGAAQRPGAAAAHAPSGADAGVVPALPAEGEPVPRAAGRYERTFGRALSFGDALHNLGLSREESNEVIAALDGILDFRRAHPEDAIVLVRGAEGRLERFEYRAGPSARYAAVRDARGRLEGQKLPLQIDTVRVARGGVVADSLGDALEGLKLGRALTGAFADVFAGKVNFSTDTRRGDTFRVLLDEEYLEGSFLRYGTIYALEYRGEKAGLLRAFWHESKQTDGDYFDAHGRALQGGWLRTPLRYDHVSSGFGVRFHPILKRKKLHAGIDYAAAPGTPVRAAAAGSVRFAGPRGPNGNLICLSHAHGYETFYAHLARFAPGIRAGARVKQRQLIAYVGSTGRSTGPHLHFALKRSGRFLDPNSQLNGPGLPLPARELPGFAQRARELAGALERIALERPAPIANGTRDGPPPLDFDEDEL